MIITEVIIIFIIQIYKLNQHHISNVKIITVKEVMFVKRRDFNTSLHLLYLFTMTLLSSKYCYTNARTRVPHPYATVYSNEEILRVILCKFMVMNWAVQ